MLNFDWLCQTTDVSRNKSFLQHVFDVWLLLIFFSQFLSAKRYQVFDSTLANSFSNQDRRESDKF